MLILLYVHNSTGVAGNKAICPTYARSTDVKLGCLIPLKWTGLKGGKDDMGFEKTTKYELFCLVKHYQIHVLDPTVIYWSVSDISETEKRDKTKKYQSTSHPFLRE